jgi:uncharacterized protein (TIGR03067 family)
LKVSVLAGVVLVGVMGCTSQSTLAKPGLDGRWTGYDMEQPEAKCTLVVKADHLEYRGAQPDDWLRGSFVLNEQARPRQMDLSVKEAGEVNRNDVGTTTLVIYELQGNELKVAVSSQDRPASFAGGSNIHVFTFRRH